MSASCNLSCVPLCELSLGCEDGARPNRAHIPHAARLVPAQVPVLCRAAGPGGRAYPAATGGAPRRGEVPRRCVGVEVWGVFCLGGRFQVGGDSPLPPHRCRSETRCEPTITCHYTRTTSNKDIAVQHTCPPPQPHPYLIHRTRCPRFRSVAATRPTTQATARTVTEGAQGAFAYIACSFFADETSALRTVQ
jgi:hypothetical protein